MKMQCLPVGMLQANCYLIWDDDLCACAIDPGGDANRIFTFLQKEELNLAAILLTHGHFDHVGGAKDLAELTEATIYCSDYIIPVLTGKEPDFSGYPIPAVPSTQVKTIAGGDKLPVGSFSVKAIATPGHTPGDLTYEIDGNLFCGDLLFWGSVGRTDFPGGDFPTLLNSVKELTEIYPAETQVYPGHSESTILGEEISSNPFLQGLK